VIGQGGKGGGGNLGKESRKFTSREENIGESGPKKKKKVRGFETAKKRKKSCAILRSDGVRKAFQVRDVLSGRRRRAWKKQKTHPKFCRSRVKISRERRTRGLLKPSHRLITRDWDGKEEIRRA